jgi:benzoyl-CoA reductase/2-hydroxyglutaryl-CoA dehydratase subunit BcrC/BadD/HgdB
MTDSPEKKKKTSARHWTRAAGKVRGLVSDMYMKAFMEGKPVAWVMYSMVNEIFLAMDVIPVYPENFGALCAVKRVGDPFMKRAEADGFSNVLCSYARIGLGYTAMWRDQGEIPKMAPDSGMFKPVMLVGSSLACDTRFKWFQSFQRYVDAPHFSFDSPIPPLETAGRPGVRGQYMKYAVAQLKELVNFLEEKLGKKMDWDRLDEYVRRGQKTYGLFHQAFMTAGKAVPCPMPAEDAFNNFVPAFFMMGQPEAVDFYQGLLDEINEKIKNGEGTIPDEKHRLIWGGGLPPWHSMKMFNYVQERGAVFVFQSVYIPMDEVDIPDKMTNPLERLAYAIYENAAQRVARDKQLGLHGLCNFVGLGNPLLYIDDMKADGVVMHWLRSCRGTTIGQIYNKRLIEERSDVPVIMLESDMCDASSFSEQTWKTRLDAFFETLESRK